MVLSILFLCTSVCALKNFKFPTCNYVASYDENEYANLWNTK